MERKKLIDEFDERYAESFETIKEELEKMVEENIPLPDQTFFEKYAVKDGNKFGNPIPVDLKIFEEL